MMASLLCSNSKTIYLPGINELIVLAEVEMGYPKPQPLLMPKVAIGIAKRWI